MNTSLIKKIAAFTASAVALAALALFLASCKKADAPIMPADVDYYTCTMHPSVHSHDPHGKCPICGMDLVPVKKSSAVLNQSATATNNMSAMDSDATKESDEVPAEFSVSVKRQQQIGVTYAAVKRQPFLHVIPAVGIVAPDKQRQWNFAPHVDGYVQKLFVFSPGDFVESNAPLMTIYSPELFAAEKEFVNVLQMFNRAPSNHSSTDLLNSTRERLHLWNVTDDQISELEHSLKPQEFLALHSPFKGIVDDLPANQGRKFVSGDRLVGITDLSVVWVWAQFYQDDLPMLKRDLPVSITIPSYPTEPLAGRISVIDPFIDEATRTVRVRIDVENPGYRLRPGMYVDVNLSMDMGEVLAVPVDAILPTGLRNLAFIDKGDGRLEPRFIQLGTKYGGFYEVKAGLQENERVVTSANFLIDAEAKVQGALKSW